MYFIYESEHDLCNYDYTNSCSKFNNTSTSANEKNERGKKDFLTTNIIRSDGTVYN